VSASNNSNTHLNLGDVLPSLSASSTNITTQSTKRQESASSLTGSNNSLSLCISSKNNLKS